MEDSSRSVAYPAGSVGMNCFELLLTGTVRSEKGSPAHNHASELPDCWLDLQRRRRPLPDGGKSALHLVCSPPSDVISILMMLSLSNPPKATAGNRARRK